MDATILSLRIILAIAIIVLCIILGILYYKHRRIGSNKEKLSRKEKLRVRTLKKITTLQREMRGMENKEIIHEFSRIIKDFLTSFLSMRYEFTYEEAEKEMEHKKINKNTRERTSLLLREISSIEYGNKTTNIDELNTLFKEAESVVKHIIPIRMKRIEILKKLKPIKFKKTDVNANFVYLRKLLEDVEKKLAKNDIEKSIELYKEIKDVYNAIPSEEKEKMRHEIIRIIKVYDILSKKKISKKK